MTVLDVIQRGAHFLKGKGVESPRLQVELLLAHVLEMPRLKLYLEFERVLPESQVETLRALVRRRGEREPLQHIIGSTSFCGLELNVSREVLVPRPETEVLAEHGWTFLNARTRDGQPARVIDFGTGSGCLAIALAAKCPTAQVFAVEQSTGALNIARSNAATHGLEGRITFIQSNKFEAFPADLRVDLLISNPPYIPSREIQALQPEVRDYDPHCALDGGEDGLEFYRFLAEAAPRFLLTGGAMMLEFGDGQELELRSLFSSPWQLRAFEKDYSGRPRFLIAAWCP